MRVFQGLSVGSDDETIINATEAIASKLYNISAPRSLCEIQTDEEDYHWIRQWAGKLIGCRVQRWLDGVSSKRIALNVSGRNLTYSEAFGCMFLLIASETARREANEGQVWSTVRQQFRGSTERALFSQRQPRESLKDAMEASARKMRLRHVYGQEGTQEYYIGVYLQFGFTRKGVAQLPHWLAGQSMPESVRYLIGEGDNYLQSESFIELWDSLKNFRRNNITRDHAHAIIEKSPWTLADWTNELLDRSRERLELGTSEAGQTTESKTEQAPPKFLNSPRLRWNMPSAPQFVSYVENLADFELDSDRYLIKSGFAKLAMVFRNSDGSYYSSPEEIVIPADSPELMVTMVDDFGNSPASQLITLWDSTKEVSIFDLSTGRSISEDSRLTSEKEYGFLLSDDLEVVPADLPFHSVGGNSLSKRMYRVAELANRPMSVSLGSETIWKSEPSLKPDKPSYSEPPSWTKDINVQVMPSNQIDLANTLPVSLSISGIDEEASLAYIRVGAQPLDFEKSEDGAYASAPFDVLARLSPRTTTPAFEVIVGLRRNDEHVSVTRSLVLSVKGVLRMSDTGWQAVTPSEYLSTSEAKQSAYRILYPNISDRKDFALMEGSVFLSRVWAIPRPIHSISGYGAPLGVRSPYNWVSDRNLLAVAEEVNDRGLVETALASQYGTLRIYLNQPLEPGELHSMVFWTPGRPPALLPAQEYVAHPEDALDIWDVRCPEGFTDEEGFAAISYDGARIGSWWSAIPYLSMGEQANALETAAMLRWIHAPILSRAWFDEIRAFAHIYPAHTLKSWIEEGGLPDGLTHGTEGEAWRAAVRQIFSGWTPDARSAKSVLGELGQKDEDITIFLSAAFQKLMRLDPLLMGRVARPLIKAPEIVRAIRLMRCLVAELPSDATHFDFDNREGELLDEVAYQMDVNDKFVDNIVRKVLSGLDYSDLNAIDRGNSQVALNIAPFREYLGLKVLSRLIN